MNKEELDLLIKNKKYSDIKKAISRGLVFLVEYVDKTDKKRNVFLTRCDYDVYMNKVNKEVQLNNLQQSSKILMNSAYGALSTKYSRFFDTDLSLSITLSGQKVTTESNAMIENYFCGDAFVTSKIARDNFKVDMSKKVGSVGVYNDTDSVASETLVTTNKGIFRIGDLYDMFSTTHETEVVKGHETINIEEDKVSSLTISDDHKRSMFGGIKRLVRHKVNKFKWKIRCGKKEVFMTEDHGCVVLRDGVLIRVSPKEIRPGDKMAVLK